MSVPGLPTASSFLQKLAYNLRYRGTGVCLFMAGYRLVQRLIPLECIVFFRMDTSVLSPGKGGVSFNVRKLSSTEIEILDSNRYDLSGFENIDMRRGHECFAACRDQIIGYVWVNYDSIYDDKLLDINLSAGQAYLYKAFTLPEYRGRGIYPELLQRVCRILKERGVHTILIATSIENRSSFRGIQKAGFERLGTVFYVKMGPFQKRIVPPMLCASGNR